MIEHEVWVGDKYKCGLGSKRQRIAIVGHSHYVSDGNDYKELTKTVVKGIQDGEKRPFFTQIQSYFDALDDKDFWNRVLFLNFVPSAVGSDKEKYAKASQEQIDLGRERFRRVLNEYQPQKVLVFSNSKDKGWQTMPDTDEEAVRDELFCLGPGDLAHFTWGTYKVEGHTILAFGLRHPERAPSDLMKRAVRHIMAI